MPTIIPHTYQIDLRSVFQGMTSRSKNQILELLEFSFEHNNLISECWELVLNSYGKITINSGSTS